MKEHYPPWYGPPPYWPMPQQTATKKQRKIPDDPDNWTIKQLLKAKERIDNHNKLIEDALKKKLEEEKKNAPKPYNPPSYTVPQIMMFMLAAQPIIGGLYLWVFFALFK